MKPPIIVAISYGLAFTATANAATDPPHHLDPAAPRTVTVSEADAPPSIRAGVLQSTLIMLPPEEKVANVFAGDTVDWVFDGGHVASRFISVKPKVANSTTDIHIVSDHGNEYTLQLREVSNDSDPHFDSRIFLAPGDKVTKDRLTQLPVFVPAAELEKAKQEAAAAKAAQTAELKAADTKAETYRSQYPGRLHFDYVWDAKKGSALGLEQIWRDDKFTYLRGRFQETPALYETKDRKGSLINFDFSNGLYTVPKELDGGYLAIGKQKVEFHRTKDKE
ncbi:TrbG/VirB9 family P-type conjugative transfer protein [Granulicella sp. dw_53]|uniref:TrbG/VirB9 family P-type conjugative transfer protein n=1 Tax=Granulicella sp. dw_53 TaxID=2719792 RepID=UPI001BD5C2B2